MIRKIASRIGYLTSINAFLSAHQSKQDTTRGKVVVTML
jgi:hypothetical protein